MRNFLKSLIFFVLTLNAFGGIPEKFPSDDLIFGKGNDSFDKSITIDIGDGGSNPKLLIDKTLKVFDFNKGLDVTGAGVFSGNISGVDGTFTGALSSDGNTITFGDGADSDKKQIWDIGAGGSNPYFGYSTTTGALVFNNGTTEKKIGSGAGGGGGGINLLVNPSFEDPGSPILNWTNTGGTFTQETYTNGRENNEKFARLVASGSGEYFLSDEVTISDDMGPGCMADMLYSQGDNSFDYKVLKSPYADPADVVSEGSVSDLTVFLKAPTIVFPCAGGDLFKFKVISTAAGTIDVDEAYLGSNKGFIAGTYANSIRLEGNGGEAITADTENIVFNGTADGWDGALYEYEIQKDGSIIGLTGSVRFTTNASRNMFLYKNGTSYARLGEQPAGVLANFHLEYKSKKGEFSKGDKLSIRVTITSTLFTADNINHFLIINEQSSDTSEAFTPEQADFFARATLGGATVTNVADGIPSDASLSLVNKFGSMSVTCTDFSQGTTVCPSGSEQLGVQLNIPVAGRVKVCFEAAVQSWSTGTTNIRVGHYQNDSDTLIVLGEGVASTNESGASNSISQVISCSYFNISNVGLNTFKIYNKAADILSTQFVIERSAAENNREAIFTVELVSHNVSRPIIQNMVDTSVGSGARVESCKINNNGTATIDSTSGMCESWVTSVTRTALGVVDIDTDKYSKTPNCEVEILYDNTTGVANPRFGHFIESLSTSSLLKVYTGYNSGAAGTRSDTDFIIKCTGAR